MKKSTLLIIVCMVCAFKLSAQVDGFSVSAGLAFPTKIGSTDADKNKDTPLGIATGMGFGLRYQNAIINSNLRYHVNIGMHYHNMSKDGKSLLLESKRALDAAYGYDRDGSSSINGSKYVYIPIYAGLNYCHPIGTQLSLFGEAGLGVVYQIITDQTYTGSYTKSQSGTVGSHYYTNTYTKNTKMVVSWENAFHFMVHVGIGFLVSERISVNVYYDWYYGKTTMVSDINTVLERDYSSDVGYNHTTDTDHPDPVKVKGDAVAEPMFGINVGFHF